MPKFLKPFYRQFLEANTGEGGSGVPQPTGTPTAQPQATGKTFSEDYVQALREEAKGNRVKAKQLEANVRTALGLDADADISKLSDYVANLKTSNEKAINEAMSKANNRLIAAEIKSKTEYDVKLLDRLLDKSKLKVEEDGSVSGLDEAIAEIEKDFPMVKLAGSGSTGANPAGGGTKTEIEKLQAEYEDAVKTGNTVKMVMFKNKLFEAQRK